MRKTILITGGSGLLALNAALVVRDKYSVVLGMHNRKITFPSTNSKVISIASEDGAIKTLLEIKPDIVFHCAALTDIELCEQKPELAKYINTDIAKNIAYACKEIDASLVHFSTDQLFSGKVKSVSENEIVSPVNVYGKTKADAEENILKIYPSALIVRTNFYGWGTAYRYSFSDYIISSLRKGRRIKLFQDVFYTPIIIETLINLVIELVNIPAKGIYHVVGNERITKNKFGLMIAKYFNLDPLLIKSNSLLDCNDLAPRPIDMSLSNKKILNLLGNRIEEISKQIIRLKEQEELGLTCSAIRL